MKHWQGWVAISCKAHCYKSRSRGGRALAEVVGAQQWSGWATHKHLRDTHLHRLWGGRNDGWMALHRLGSWWGWGLRGYRRGSLQWLGRHHCDRGLDNEVWGDGGEGVRCGLHRWRVLLRGLCLRRSRCLRCVWYRRDARFCRPYQP